MSTLRVSLLVSLVALAGCGDGLGSGDGGRDATIGDALVGDARDIVRLDVRPDDVFDDAIAVDGGDLDASSNDTVSLDATANDGATVPDAMPDAGPPVTRVGAVEQASGRVLVFDTAVADWSSAASIVWSWSPSNSPQIATANRGWFSTLSDVKLKNDGRTVIVAASGGGVAIIRASDRAVTFYANQGGNPHAVELLPDGNLVGVSSTGSFVRVYSTDPAVSHFPGTIVSMPVTLADAHGVYWDGAHNRVLALGGTTLVAYRYGGTRQHPTLTAIGSWPLPTAGGHDLYPVPNVHRVFVTTGSHVYEFDTDTNAFVTSPRFPDRGAVKSVGVNPVTGQAVFTTPMTSWWTEIVNFYGPAGTRTRTGARFYKARWWFSAT